MTWNHNLSFFIRWRKLQKKKTPYKIVNKYTRIVKALSLILFWAIVLWKWKWDNKLVKISKNTKERTYFSLFLLPQVHPQVWCSKVILRYSHWVQTLTNVNLHSSIVVVSTLNFSLYFSINIWFVFLDGREALIPLRVES